MRAKGEGTIYYEHAKDCPTPHVEGCTGRGCSCRKDGDCDGRWVAQLDFGHVDDTGTRRRPKRRRKTKAAARRALEEMRKESGSRAARDDVTVGEWLEHWLTDCVQRFHAGQMSPKTVVGYESKVRQHIRPAIGHIRLDLLTPGDVNRMITSVMAKGRSPQTAKSCRIILSAALSAAVAEGLVTINVAPATRAPAIPKKVVSAFDDDEYEAIMGQCEHSPIGTAVQFFLLTGVRTSELLGLKWEGVDLEDLTYQVDRTLHHVGGGAADLLEVEPGAVESNPKNVGSGEVTPMSPAAGEVLRRQRKLQTEQRLAAADWHDSGHVFTGPDGEPLTSENLRYEMRKLLKAAGVQPRTRDGRGRLLHELRRTWTSRMRDAGVPIEYVQRLGRWASPQMLLTTYRALDEEALRRAAGQDE